MRRPLLCLAVAMIAASCESTPTAPVPTDLVPSLDNGRDGTPAHENKRIPFAGTVNNPCPPIPEAVAVEGFTQFSSHFKFFDGGNTSKHHIMNVAQGVGLVTGAKYTFQEMFRQDATYYYDTKLYDTEQTIRYRVVSQYNLGNFFATTHQKVICVNDVCRVEPISFESDCRG
jgi:hypothetical protein